MKSDYYFLFVQTRVFLSTMTIMMSRVFDILFYFKIDVSTNTIANIQNKIDKGVTVSNRMKSQKLF